MSRRAGGERSKELVAGIVRGAVAGVEGTTAMDLSQYARHRARGAQEPFWRFEFCAAESFDDALAPAEIAQIAVEKVFGAKIPDRHVNLANNVMHWGYGISWASALGLVTGRSRVRRWTSSVAYGSIVFLSGYFVLPMLGLYKPLWEQDPSSIRRDWVGHLLYSVTTHATLGALVRSAR